MTAVPPRPAAPDATAGGGLRDLRCPYCGSEIEAELTYTPMSYSEHRDLTGYECDNWECNARWDKNGVAERPSKLALPALRDVLAAARDDAQRVVTLEAQCAALQRLAEECEAAAARDAEKVRRVEAVHAPVEAVQYIGSRNVPRRVCAGCGTDDGNWQIWPCPTVRAITVAGEVDR